MKTKGRKRYTILLVFAGLLLLIAIPLSYYQLLYKPHEVNSNIYKPYKTFTAHNDEVWVAKFSPKGGVVASGGVDSTVKIWDYKGNIINNLRHPAGVTSLSYSNDGNYIVTSSYDTKVRIWDANNGSLLKTLSGHEGTVWCVAFSPDGKTVASCGEDKTIKLWNVVTGDCIKTLKAHTLNIWAVKFTPDGSTIISSSFDKTIKIWNIATGIPEKTLAGHTEAIVDIAISPNGQLLASASDDKTIKLWRINDGKLLYTLQDGNEHVQGLDFSADSKMLISSGRDKPAIGELLQNLFGDSEYNKGVSMRLWDLKTFTVIQTFRHHTNDVNDVNFSPDDKWIVSASSDKTVCLWHASF